MPTKKPADHKQAAHSKSEQFTWDNGDGITLTVPYLENVRMGVMRRSSELEGLAQVFALLKGVDADMDAVDELTQLEFKKFSDDWNEASAADLGE